MERKEFLHRGLLGTALAFIGGALSGTAKAIENLAGSGQAATSGRGVEGVLSPTNTHMVGNGFKVMNYFPNGKGFEERMSPFFLLDFNAEVNFPPSDISQGVGVHPHRGIETITFAYKGSVEHHDSKGNHGIIHPGDIQWMTAGRGIIHRELAFRNEHAHTLQLWVNLPSRRKMTDTGYQDLRAEARPSVRTAGVLIDVVSGTVDGIRGAARNQHLIQGCIVSLDPGTSVHYSLPPSHRAFLYVLDGAATIGGRTVRDGQVAWSDPAPGGSTGITIASDSREGVTRVMAYSGEPLREPVVAGGPFVMNSRAEIETAYRDYHSGKFGAIPRQARLKRT